MLCVEKKLLDLEFNILLHCCDLENSNIELIDSKSNRLGNITYPTSYKINEALPFYFEDCLRTNRILTIGKIEHNDELSFSDNDYYIYTIHNQYIDFADASSVSIDSLYNNFYGLTIDVTHKRLYYFILKQSKLVKRELVKRLPEFYKKEFKKVSYMLT